MIRVLPLYDSIGRRKGCRRNKEGLGRGAGNGEVEIVCDGREGRPRSDGPGGVRVGNEGWVSLRCSYPVINREGGKKEWEERRERRRRL